MKKLLRRLLDGKYGQVIRYLIVGGLTTLVSLAVFQGLCIAFGVDPEAPDSPYVTAANFISIVAAIVFAYVFNKKFVFRSKCETPGALAREFAEFIGGRIFTMLVELGGVYLFVNILGQYPLLGKIEIEIIIVILNYVISRFIVFSKKKYNGGHDDTHIAK